MDRYLWQHSKCTIVTLKKHFPFVGAAFCTKHRKSITSTQEEENTENSTKQLNCSTLDADDYVPEEPLISEEAIEKATTSANSLCDATVTSPLSFQIKETRVNDLSENTKQKLRQKFERVKLQLEKKFAEAIAPGQSEELISHVLNHSDSQKHDPVPEDITTLIDMFKESDSFEQIILLSVVNHDK